MSDEIDQANEQAERIHTSELAVRKPIGPEATGECLYCGEETPKRWCSFDCMSEWQFDQDRRRQAAWP